MGTAFVNPKPKKNSFISNSQKTQIKIQLDLNKPIPLQTTQLINWSLHEIKTLYQGFQRISQSPMMDSFLFKKLMPMANRNSRGIFAELSNGGILVLVFDLQRKGHLNGHQFLVMFYSMFYGFCRLTNQPLSKFEDLQRFAIAIFFSGEDDYEERQIGLRKLMDQYEGNLSINMIFNRFQKAQWKHVREDPLIYSSSQFKKFTKEKSNRFYRILLKIYQKNDYEQLFLLEQGKQLRRQSRRDSCLRKIISQKYDFVDNEQSSPIKKAISLRKIISYTPSSIKNTRHEHISSARESDGFRIKKTLSCFKGKSVQKKNIFLKGNLHSRNSVFESINYFKSISDNEQKINMKDFFKSFSQNVFLKKQLGSIFKFLDYDKNGEITLLGYFKSIYPGLKQADIILLSKWYSQYKEIYEADSLQKNQIKVLKISQARILPSDTFQRVKQIFTVLDNGNKGYLNFDDIKKSYKQGFTTKELEQLLKQYGDGKRIDIKGLCKMLIPADWKIEGMDL